MYKWTGKVIIIFGIVFIVVAIIVPGCIILTTEPEYCEDAETITPGSQVSCTRDYDQWWTKKKWIAKYGKNGSDCVNVYYSYFPFNGSLPDPVTRTFSSSSHSLVLDRDYYSVGIPYASSISMKMDCSSEDVQTYLIERSVYEEAGGKKGKLDPSSITFKDGYNYKVDKCLEPGEVFQTEPFYKRYYFLVFFNAKSEKVTVNFQYNLTFEVFDLSSSTPKKCEDNECVFPRISFPEVIFIDYPNVSGCPETVEVAIYDIVIDWVAVGVSGGVLALFAIIVLVIGIVVYAKGKPINENCSIEKKALIDDQKPKNENSSQQA